MKLSILKKSALLLAVAILTYAPRLPAAENDAGKPNSPIDDWLRNGRLTLHLRNYYLHRSFESDKPFAESMAGGGWLEYESALWHNLGFGIAGYTSQGWGFTDPDHDGTCLLAPGQTSYSVLGQANLRFEPKDWKFIAYRQILDTPFINPNDSRMTPQTFEAYTIENFTLPGLYFILSQVTAMKNQNDDTFKNMSEAADTECDLSELGAVNRGVTMAGTIWDSAGAGLGTFQIWNYYARDYMNTVFAQWNGKWQPTDNWSWSLGAQAIDQRDTGDSLGGEFQTGQSCTHAGIAAGGLELMLAASITDSRHDMQSPWGGYPGYTSMVLEDNNRAGDKAWAVGLSYDAANIGLAGLNATIWHAQAFSPDTGAHASPDQTENNITVDYQFPGFLSNLKLRLRWADINQSPTAGGSDYTDYRVIVNYEVNLI